MKIKRAASIGLLVVSMGLFGTESANAKNLQKEESTSVPTTDVSRPSQINIIAQVGGVTPLQGTWNLTYSVAGFVYKSVLTLNGYSGTMITRYVNPRTLKTETVQQTMYLEPFAEGLLIRGYKPVYAGTSIEDREYYPDNFLISIQPDRPPIFMTCDTASQCSTVAVERIK